MALSRFAALALATMALIVPANAKANCLKLLSEYKDRCYYRSPNTPVHIDSISSPCTVERRDGLQRNPADRKTTYTLSWFDMDRMKYTIWGGPGRSGRGRAMASMLSSPIRWELHGETIVFFHENGEIVAIRWNTSASGNTADVPVPLHIERPGGVYSGGAYYVNGYRFVPRLETP